MAISPTTLKNKMKKLYLKNKKRNDIYTLVDDDDYEKFGQYSWNLGTGNYVVRSAKPRNIFLHREIMNTPKGMFTDHINHNRLDNRKCNLRICTISQNLANSNKGRQGNTYKGVTWHILHQKWEVKFMSQGKYYFIGYFNTQEEAIEAYNKKAKEILGEFACPIGV